MERLWRQALGAAGLPAEAVGRVDGDVVAGERQGHLRRSRVLVVTPDVLHAWLLPNISDSNVWDFVRHIRLIVVDEVHVYTGVFGSNAAFLFRRLEHLMHVGGGRAQYIVASATVHEPARHLEALFGRQFSIVDESMDTSGRFPLTVHMVNPNGKDPLTSLSELDKELAAQSETRFITFVDSRKQTELVASIIGRSRQHESEEVPEISPRALNLLERLDVVPYRAGFEDSDRAVIEERLASGRLRGVISTSALELGIAIPHLDIGILFGVPRSMTSLQQRLGRVGRHRPGMVIVINNGDLYSEAMFKNPGEALDRPLAEPALYLENPRIQYIHAMCLARVGGEHDQACEKAHTSSENGFDTGVNWPAGFVELCEKERVGDVPVDLRPMKAEAGDAPHLTFPLRDVESQFKVEARRGPEIELLGSLSHAQLMREAYPGAVYYYMTVPYRVVQVHLQSKTVRARREKAYTTTPVMAPAMIIPILSEDSVYRSARLGDLVMVETTLQVRESVMGFKERRGSNDISQAYPLAGGGITFPQQFFTRNFFTTGTVLFHPALAAPGVHLPALAELIYECFLMEVPFERHDIHSGAGRLRLSRGPLEKDSRFLAIYDQTYGSLRLSGRLLDPGVIEQVVARAVAVGRDESLPALPGETAAALEALAESLSGPRSEVALGLPAGELSQGGDATATVGGGSARVRVIMPGSTRLDRARGNEEFHVEGVFYSPKDGAVRYRGRHPSDWNENVTVIVPPENIIAIPGESRMGFYDIETGTLAEDPAEGL